MAAREVLVVLLKTFVCDARKPRIWGGGGGREYKLDLIVQVIIRILIQRVCRSPWMLQMLSLSDILEGLLWEIVNEAIDDGYM